MELFVVWNLDIISTRILCLAITIEIISIALNSLRILLLLWYISSLVVILSVVGRVRGNKRVLILACLVDALHLEHRAKGCVLVETTRSSLWHQGWACNPWLGRLEARLVNTHFATSDSFLFNSRFHILNLMFALLVVVFLVRQPLNSQHDIVLWNIKSAEVLLGRIRTKEVIELYIGTSLFVKHLYVHNGTKLTKNLKQMLS